MSNEELKESDDSHPHIIVIGAGSIGKRHAENLVKLGATVDIYDLNKLLADQVCSQTGCTRVDDLDKALCHGTYQAGIVCTPNHLHVPVAKKVAAASMDIFIEKPLSDSFGGVESLVSEVKSRDLICMAGFNLRYEPGLQLIKKILKPEDVAFALIECGSYLPSWRPHSDYRKQYSANRSMGGGIILDDVHEIDYACWLFGYPEKVQCTYGRFSNLEIDVEDTAEFILQYPGKLVTIHSDYLQQKYTRKCKICLRNGETIEWVFGESVTGYTSTKNEIFNYKDQFLINDMYLAEMKEFLECINKRRIPDSNLENAVKILIIALEAKCGTSI
jgi:predicted dehydrogenase